MSLLLTTASANCETKSLYVQTTSVGNKTRNVIWKNYVFGICPSFDVPTTLVTEGGVVLEMLCFLECQTMDEIQKRCNPEYNLFDIQLLVLCCEIPACLLLV